MRYLIIILFLHPLFANSQTTLDLGNVKIDSSFECLDRMVRDSFDFGVNEICNSKNDIEIRLKSFYRPGGGRKLIVLSYSNGIWDLKRYQYVGMGMGGRKMETTSFKNNQETRSDKLFEIRYTMLFDTLKLNNIFLLPDQSELGHELTVFDGSMYDITYKIGHQFRTYRYENPEKYLLRFPEKTEYKELMTIIRALRNFFE